MMKTSFVENTSSCLILEARSVQPRETNWELFCDDFCSENGATAIGTVPTIGHGPTYGWVNYKRASQMYTRNQYDFKLN